MTPSARVNATIEILEKARDSNFNIDKVILSYFRKRRFAGSKDRAFITERVYYLIRNQIKINWWLKKLGVEASPRLRVLAGLAFSNEGSKEEIENLFSDRQHSASELNDVEREILKQLEFKALVAEEMPDNIKSECPDWIAEKLQPIYKTELKSYMEALNREASFDLRLNILKRPDRERAQRSLEKQGLLTEIMPYSPFGLRAQTRQRINGTKFFKSGLVEIQDEGAQLAALLVGAAPGMQVADFCAGSGGKTLVMGGLMQNTGRIVAMDVSQKRLEQAGIRISRGGLHNVERKLINDENDKKLKRLAKKFDRVLVDAPCTGIGTWRRDPDTRLRYSAADLENMISLQDQILTSAARLTKPGGRLIYVTCSLFLEENEDRIAALLSRRKDYEMLPISEIWSQEITARGGGACPTESDVLRLTPKEHNTDGFFAAVLQRSMN